ncbi:8069_t:CDS:2 [Rhizophagus irregularis]|nr:8069_t:CDS:2 [Rhizophagus irregularis]
MCTIKFIHTNTNSATQISIVTTSESVILENLRLKHKKNKNISKLVI